MPDCYAIFAYQGGESRPVGFPFQTLDDLVANLTGLVAKIPQGVMQGNAEDLPDRMIQPPLGHVFPRPLNQEQQVTFMEAYQRMTNKDQR
ncbi:hypothetical protein AUJ68_04620 [Candidatus Woesearchaeota archaeon CG1_02_57_44]|nr:MAG: hypothetical protein AUJ68_04620 [Candidatus Woesearchaeota archaeon CG1_02_57_44]PIN67716.1 MAG: hypothetical protein COV94_06790 [Candidatus Woesearchaeota archaeon CG11_big_fil_rev_8_21_14_0_20_57_5]